MSDIVIKAENLGKRYTIGHQRGRGEQTTFREVLIQNAGNLWNKSRDLFTGKPVIAGDTLEEIWALKDVSFEIKRGEAVGIIGRNGAGKSTLLKILSRITEPTEGRVTIKGRVASLLEVGTGFHSELTGRENIYLNGTILGMTRTEIKRKFDDIVSFSGIEKYLDTPVKRYSSGMYVRLAFAVAAHLESEILIVDEVLAVGDAEFRKKCLGKMQEVATGQGRTVLFVSHDMAAIRNLCGRVILLLDGFISSDGDTDHVVDSYLRKITEKNLEPREKRLSKYITSVSLSSASGREYLSTEDSIIFTIEVDTFDKIIDHLRIGIGINHIAGARILTVLSNNEGKSWHGVSGKFEMHVTIDSPHLAPGIYRLKVAIGDALADFDTVEDALSFQVEPTDFFGTGKLPNSQQGVILARSTWILKN
jgi:lipopolysaccharide transport system ATP-binding protein